MLNTFFQFYQTHLLCAPAFLIAIIRSLFIFFTARVRQYKCIITLSQSASCSYLALFFLYVLVLVSSCVLLVIVNESFSTRLTVVYILPDFFCFLILKVSRNRKGMRKIQKFLDTTWNRRIFPVILFIPIFMYLGSSSNFDYMSFIPSV